MNLVYELLVVMFVAGVIISLAAIIMQLYVKYQDNVFYDSWKRNSKRLRLIHFDKVDVDKFDTEYTFKYCSDVRKILD